MKRTQLFVYTPPFMAFLNESKFIRKEIEYAKNTMGGGIPRQC